MMVLQPMNQNKTRLGAITLVVLAVTLLTACAGKKTTTEAAETKDAVADITRPPQTVKREREVVEETNPDETISFDEWRKRRQAELEAQDRGE